MATQTNDAAGQAADAAPGMPQLDFSTFGNQIFWLVVTLVAIYLILDRIALPRIAEVLAERQDRITGDIAAAEDLKAQALAAEEAYNKALAEARTEAQPLWQKPRPTCRSNWEPLLPRQMLKLPPKRQCLKRPSPKFGPVRWTVSASWPQKPQQRWLRPLVGARMRMQSPPR